MEQAAGVRYHTSGSQAGKTMAGSPVMVRYADDLVALCASRKQAEEVKERLAAWMTPRGLAFNEDKTRIVHLDDGFDFLGFNVRRYRGKLLIKPSKAALRRHRERLAAEVRALRGANAVAVIQRLNPIIRGWSAYYRTVVSSAAFAKLDHYLWKLIYKWACRSHRNKSGRWVFNRYFDAFNKSRRARWVFGDRDSGAYLLKHAWTNIVRHQMVPGTASPDDPSLADYWARRRQRHLPPFDGVTVRLLKAQRGRCPVCGGLLLLADREPQDLPQWEQWLKVVRKALRRQAVTTQEDPGTTDETVTIRLIHAHCGPRHNAKTRITPSSTPARP
jgi:RNA-directed DNA polymerase